MSLFPPILNKARKNVSHLIRHNAFLLLSYIYRKRKEAEISGLYPGKRVFLIGNGPSLSKMNLEMLANEYICTVNMGFRSVGKIIDHTNFHIIADKNRYKRFGTEIEDFFNAHGHPDIRFMGWHCKRLYKKNGSRQKPIYFWAQARLVTDAHNEISFFKGLMGGSTILLSAAQLLHLMGFSEIYILGCDLDYDQASPYFYDSSALDRLHQEDPTVQSRRQLLAHANHEFEALHASLARFGCFIANAGAGGKLDSIPRVDFHTLFHPAVNELGGVTNPASFPAHPHPISAQ